MYILVFGEVGGGGGGGVIHVSFLLLDNNGLLWVYDRQRQCCLTLAIWACLSVYFVQTEKLWIKIDQDNLKI